jgi:ankyrin repeat protein
MNRNIRRTCSEGALGCFLIAVSVAAIAATPPSPLQASSVLTDVRVQGAHAVVEHGADVNRRGRKGQIALVTTSYLGAASTVALLLKAGARVDEADEDIGQTAFMAAAKGGRIEIMKQLVAHGANADLKDKRGGTALHWSATEHDHPDVARYLLSLGLDPNEKNASGRTAKDYARALKYQEMLKVMEQE